MAPREQHESPDQSLDQIEGIILPCITIMLETLVVAWAEAATIKPGRLAASIRSLAVELDQLTQSVELSTPVCHSPRLCDTRRPIWL